MPVLTGIDVLGLQRYVFASNRLGDVIAASWLVNWTVASNGALAGAGDGSLLLAAGGNAILKFPDLKRAQSFASHYSRRLYEEAPGLEVAIAHRQYDSGGLSRALRLLQVDLARTKLEQTPSVPQLGLGVTMRCRITGLPAVEIDAMENNAPISRRIARLRDSTVRRSAVIQWNRFLDADDALEFPADLDHLGRSKGDTSLIAIVHVDVNDIGHSINEWLSRSEDAKLDDGELESQYRQWSVALTNAGRDALNRVVHRVRRTVNLQSANLNGSIKDLSFQLKVENSRVYLPLRPVLLGGDDLTFICDGRIALDLANTATQALATQLPHLGQTSACAGVALAPSHAPFDRAYDLSEKLCANAKRRRREVQDPGNWIDWHIGTPPVREGIAGFRSRSYTHTLGTELLSLTCRPYRLGSSATEPETWRWLSDTVLGTSAEGFRGDHWGEHRNKLKQLASLVREGRDGVGRGRAAWTSAASIKLPPPLEQSNGFFADRTPLLDAVELLDLHLPLDQGNA
jgi:hypothetical protein